MKSLVFLLTLASKPGMNIPIRSLVTKAPVPILNVTIENVPIPDNLTKEDAIQLQTKLFDKLIADQEKIRESCRKKLAQSITPEEAQAIQEACDYLLAALMKSYSNAVAQLRKFQ